MFKSVSNHCQTLFNTCPTPFKHTFNTCSYFSKQFKHMSTHVQHQSQIVHTSSTFVSGTCSTHCQTIFKINSNTLPNSCLAHVHIRFNICSNDFEHGVNTVPAHFPHVQHMFKQLQHMSNTTQTHFKICSTYCQYMFDTFAKSLPNHFRPSFKPCSNQSQHRSDILQYCS